MAETVGPPQPGLRERKRTSTERKIRETAWRLFVVHGFERTTVEQIAGEAEVAVSTVFRYFRSKDDLRSLDPYQSVFEAAFRAQPADLAHPVQALRGALAVLSAETSRSQVGASLDRALPFMAAPMLSGESNVVDSRRLLRRLFAERLGADSNDLKVEVMAGAALGVMLGAVMCRAGEAGHDPVARVDEALSCLAESMPLPG